MKDNSPYSIFPYKGQLVKLHSARTARAYYLNYYIDLLTGEKVLCQFNHWVESLCFIKVSSNTCTPRIIQLFYELSHFITNDHSRLEESTLLAIDIEYSEHEKVKLLKKSRDLGLRSLESPDFAHYKKAFLKGRSELLKGNSYQFNLTCPFKYSFIPGILPEEFISSLWSSPKKRGAYGSATFLPYFNRLLLSNSPECLFQIKNNVLSSMPIKGTILCSDHKKWRQFFSRLVLDDKNKAELFMIADLIRNDLSRIELPRAQVIRKRAPLLVPGLVHQYAQIDVELGPDVHLWRIIDKLFPGGSVTGAPKVRAINLLRDLEKRERRSYCGSTLLLYKEMKSASINIRSAEIDFNHCELHYQAGGGITLLSECEDEFKEMAYKRDSFVNNLTP